jgi:hypothetical protein
VTGGYGYYFFGVVHPGTYEVKVEPSGFNEVRSAHVALPANIIPTSRIGPIAGKVRRATNTNMNAIDEVNYSTDNYDAEHGRAVDEESLSHALSALNPHLISQMQR